MSTYRYETHQVTWEDYQKINLRTLFKGGVVVDGTGDETPEGDEIHLIIIRIEEDAYGDQSDEDGARYE